MQRIAVAALLLTGLTLACSPSPAPPVPAAQPAAGGSQTPPPIAIRAAYTSIAANQAPWWVAQDAGYFREQGLNVDLSHIDSGATLLAALQNNEIQFTASGGPALVVGYLQGLETIIVGSSSNVLDAIVFTRPEIQTVADLRGKTIGVSRLKSVTDVAARLGFQRVGLQPDVDVFTRGTGGMAESLAAVENGAADGASINGPAIFDARKRGYRELLAIQDLGIPFLTAGIGTTRRVATEQPEIVQRGVRAIAQSISRILTDRELTAQVMGKYLKTDDRELLNNTIDYIRPQFQPDLYPDPAAVQAVLDLEENPAARTTRPEELTDYRFVEELRTSGFLDRLPK